MRVLIIFLFSVYCNHSLACECKAYPFVKDKSQSELKLEASFKNSDIIFYGEYIGGGKFELIKVYHRKAFISNQNVIEEKEERYICDYSFKANMKYLVFGNVDEKGKLWTSICLSNTLIKNESELSFVEDYLGN